MAPNPIDFDKVFAAFGNLAESGNIVVLVQFVSSLDCTRSPSSLQEGKTNRMS